MFVGHSLQYLSICISVWQTFLCQCIIWENGCDKGPQRLPYLQSKCVCPLSVWQTCAYCWKKVSWKWLCAWLCFTEVWGAVFPVRGWPHGVYGGQLRGPHVWPLPRLCQVTYTTLVGRTLILLLPTKHVHFSGYILKKVKIFLLTVD